MPHTKPFGATSNPDRRVTDATQNHASAPPPDRNFGGLMNDSG